MKRDTRPGPQAKYSKHIKHAYDGADIETKMMIDDERKLTTLRAERDELLAALADVELRCTQAKMASTIGKGKDRTEFLRGELERISEHARAAIARCKA